MLIALASPGDADRRRSGAGSALPTTTDAWASDTLQPSRLFYSISPANAELGDKMNEGPKQLDFHGERTVVLPCEPDQFRDFIAGLLGQPQTIERRFHVRFEVTRADLENLYHLIDQRISSQNDAQLIQFTARISYSDDSSVLLNSLSDFKTYNEVKSIVSQRVYLTWTYLVKFRNSHFPEKQQIEVGFVTSPERDQIRLRAVAREFPILPPTDWERTTIRIQHTDRSWGGDLEALLTSHLQNFWKHDSELREWIRKYSGLIGISVFVLLISAMTYTLNKVSSTFREKILSSFKFEFVDPITTEQLAKQSSLILRWIIDQPASHGYFLATGLLGTFVIVVLSVVVGQTASERVRSFVLLSKAAEEQRSRIYATDKSN